jgi:hypothetical protein
MHVVTWDWTGTCSDWLSITGDLFGPCLVVRDRWRVSNFLWLSHLILLTPLIAELNLIFHLLALLGAHHILHVSVLRVNTVFIRRTSGRSLRTLKHGSFLWNIGKHRTAQEKTTFRQLNKGWLWFSHERIKDCLRWKWSQSPVDCRVNRDDNTAIDILAPGRNVVSL